MNKYKAIIGLEMHCEISKTNSKVFSSARNSYEELPNINVRPLDLGFPGTLPVLNKKAVEKALMASIILNCKQPEYLYFERKNYYYPDLPKGYQLTQETKPCPIGIFGNINYELDDKEYTAIINNIHLEEDSASLDHYDDYSTIDYNRSGVPLLELVTEPCFHSSNEAVAFLETMRNIYKYANISDADTKKGQIRCDVNVSIMPFDADENNKNNFGTKVEIKNVNSFGGVRDAINYEIKRQIELKENGTYNKMEQQTRRWDADNLKTVYMRSKVDAIDYKYFVEPNIPKFKVTDLWLESIKKQIPVLPNERKKHYINELNLSKYDANVLISNFDLANYFEELINLKVNPSDACKWVTVVLLGTMNKLSVSIYELGISADILSEVIKLVENNKLSLLNAKNVFYKAVELKKNPMDIIKEEELIQIDNDDLIIEIIKKVIDNEPNAVTEYKNGKDHIANYFVGCVMKATKGKANPNKTLEMIKVELNNR